jgi:hypothetical protein
LSERRARASDGVDLETLALALAWCGLVTCDAKMADSCAGAASTLTFGCELFTGWRETSTVFAHLASETGSDSQAAAGTAAAGRHR